MALTKNDCWLNCNGREIPPANIDKVQKEKDRVVEEIIAEGKKLEQLMREYKARAIAKIDKYLEFVKKHERVRKGNIKGNYTLSDYSNVKKVEVSINEVIAFDERFNLAKDLIDQCMKKWTAKGSQNIRAIIEDAFNVDKKGNVNKMMVIRLLKLEIKDSTWCKAMDLIRKSMEVTATRQYFNLRTRNSYLDQWTTVNLNLSSM